MKTYTVSSVEDLSKIRDNSGSKFIFTDDINLHGDLWKPIDKFYGQIDGQGYTLKNFEIDSSMLHSGFILEMYEMRGRDCMVENLNFEDVTINSGSTDKSLLLGSIVAKNNGGTIKNCKVKDSYIIDESSLSNGANYIGGLVAKTHNKGNICNCSVENLSISGAIEKETNIGGIAGTAISISNCQILNSRMNNGNYIGGIVGELPLSASIERSSSEYCSINNGDYIGGICGKLEGTIYNVDRDGTIISDSHSSIYSRDDLHVGGVAGKAKESFKVLNTHWSGDFSRFGGTKDTEGSVIENSNDMSTPEAANSAVISNIL